jgi:hypothetical protein
VVVKKQPVKQPVKAVPRPVAAKKPFTMRHLWRMTLWAGTATGALLVAVLTTRSEVGTERVASAFPSLRGSDRAQMAARSIDTQQAETRRLAAAVHNLAAENNQLQSRLTAVEQNMSDITGSVSRQIAAVKAETKNPWPADATAAPISAADIVSTVTPTAGFGAPLPSPPQTSPPQPASAQAPAPAVTAPEYAIDIGGALSIQALRARWLGIRSAHPQLFEGLIPTVALREVAKSKRVELRLVVGPLANAEAAARLCAALVPFRLYCQPASFGSQHIALE